jgi:hypothetical protein
MIASIIKIREGQILKKKIASTTGLIIALLETVSGEAMRPMGEGEDLRSSFISVRVDEIVHRIVGDEAEVCRYMGRERNISISSCVFDPVRGKSCPVTRIALGSLEYTFIRSVTIPRTVQILRTNCFSRCWSLENISFETNSQLRCIESRAFYNSFLKSITIPHHVEVLGSECFSECRFLRSISFEPNSRLQCIEFLAFAETNLKGIIIPKSVEILGGYCFGWCQSLKSISFEADSQLRNIKSLAFSETSLKCIKIPPRVKVLGSVCSERLCPKKITIPCHVEILGSRCFSECQSLEHVSFEPNSRLKRIELEAFYKTSLKSITIPRRVEILESACFCWCGSLGDISFETDSQLRHIGLSAFWGSPLKSITIPRHVEILGSGCFGECPSLESISFETDSGQEKRITISGSEQREIQLSQNIQLFLRECCPRTKDVSVTMVENPR